MLDHCVLEGCVYSELGQHTPVINKDNLGYLLHVHIPHEIFPSYSLYEIYDTETNTALDNVLKTAKYDSYHPWIDIQSNKLNTSSGYHKYRLGFVDKFNSSTTYLFIAYIIQDDDPEKPYYYMANARNVN